MTAREEIIDGGRKIVLRRDNGELAGSRSIAGKSGIAAPVASAPVAFPGALGIVDSTQLDEAEVFLNLIHHSDMPAVDEDFDAVEHRAAWLEKLPEPLQVGYLTMRTLPTSLGEDQAQYVFTALRNSVKRWDPAPVEPTDQEWETYLAETAAKLADPENMMTPEARADALARLGALSIGPKPDGPTFAVMVNAPKRAWQAKFALDQQALQIASWVDADEYEVKRMVTRFRSEYYALADAGTPPEIDPKYHSAWKRTDWYSPKDAATAYSHWKAENPELYLNPEEPRRFVALDLETTGLSTRDSDIIEVGLVEYDAKGREIGSWNQLVRPPAQPDGSISVGDEKVQSVHKISVEDVINQPTFDQILPELHKRLVGATVIGHNLAFDTRHLRTNFRSYAPDGDRELSKAPWKGEADTLFHAARHMDGLENNKLQTVSQSLGISYTNGHRAEHDARAAGEVFFALRKQIKRRQAAAIAAAGQR
jgi:DNA polymerase III epsilon subunit-like protein